MLIETTRLLLKLSVTTIYIELAVKSFALLYLINRLSKLGVFANT
ncbi:hypothetical protein A5E_1896 [Vibrio cholerae B33]|nr:hypothetical protein A5E_1896 [Vibrio cholerae B33]